MIPTVLNNQNNAIEFFSENSIIYVISNMQITKIESIDDIPDEAYAVIRKAIDTNPKYGYGLELMAGKDEFKQIKQFIKCKCGEFDRFPDIYNGHLTEEFCDCAFKNRCVGAKYLCKLNEYNLTWQERKIIMYVAKDMANKQIGNTLGISEYTVNNEITAIKQKTGCESKQGIVAFAYKHDIL